jgi:hypothetical protein
MLLDVTDRDALRWIKEEHVVNEIPDVVLELRHFKLDPIDFEKKIPK